MKEKVVQKYWRLDLFDFEGTIVGEQRIAVHDGLDHLQIGCWECPSPSTVVALGGVHEMLSMPEYGFIAIPRDSVTCISDAEGSNKFGASFDSPFGRRLVKPVEYMESISALKPNLWSSLPDEVPAWVSDKRNKLSVDRTTRWLDECLALRPIYAETALGPIVGGTNLEERIRSAQDVASRNVSGFWLGGFGLGESAEQRPALLDAVMGFSAYEDFVEGETEGESDLSLDSKCNMELPIIRGAEFQIGCPSSKKRDYVVGMKKEMPLTWCYAWFHIQDAALQYAKHHRSSLYQKSTSARSGAGDCAISCTLKPAVLNCDAVVEQDFESGPMNKRYGKWSTGSLFRDSLTSDESPMAESVSPISRVLKSEPQRCELKTLFTGLCSLLESIQRLNYPVGIEVTLITSLHHHVVLIPLFQEEECDHLDVQELEPTPAIVGEITISFVSAVVSVSRVRTMLIHLLIYPPLLGKILHNTMSKLFMLYCPSSNYL
ncbi:hypothetical protein KI387_002263 [Taxus chinensis]|uniref:tRNA-guanine(15) transglycosylase-like domain-containing protein n=1 Tax=Taxus chinensis TaxID=29808 RepID=A0AA38LPS3_TAXCH|nr:hypothetical protein KI387_002263 [Taxus chinensis]